MWYFVARNNRVLAVMRERKSTMDNVFILSKFTAQDLGKTTLGAISDVNI